MVHGCCSKSKVGNHNDHDGNVDNGKLLLSSNLGNLGLNQVATFVKVPPYSEQRFA